MEASIVFLGIIVLFGAGALFKATNFFEKGGTRLFSEPQQDTPSSEPEPPEEQREEERGPSPTLDRRHGVRICRNCLTECAINVEYCSECGKKLTRPKGMQITEKQTKWFKRFNWIQNPFTFDVLPALFTGYKEEAQTVMEKLSLRSGHILVTGDVGTGKTTFLRWLELNLPDSFHPLYIFRPPEKFSELIDLIAYTIEPQRGIKPGEYTLYNIDKLLKRLNKTFVLLLDEAHEFDVRIKKPLKTLGDIEGVHLVLAGLPEIVGRLKKESPPLYDRIVANVELTRLNPEYTKDLIVKRIENAGGWGNDPFTEDAISKIHKLSGGNPRSIIKTCDKAVTEAIDKGILSIDKSVIDSLLSIDQRPKREPQPEKPPEKPSGKPTEKSPKKPAGKPPEKKEEEPQKEEIKKDTAPLDNAVKERLTKLDTMHKKYNDSGDADGVREVVNIVKSSLSDTIDKLDDTSIPGEEKERLHKLEKTFTDWLTEHE